MAAVALAVASYTSSITKLPESTDTPEDARAKPHHVTKNGSIVHFKNPHPSYQKLNPVRDIVW